MPKRLNIVETTMTDMVERAKMGDKHALEEIIRKIQDNVYGLAIRMLFVPADAEDATQEILVKVITNLGTFKGESRFETWVYRIASNHLLTTHKCRAERWELTFETCENMINEGIRNGGEIFFKYPLILTFSHQGRRNSKNAIHPRVKHEGLLHIFINRQHKEYFL